MTTLYHHEPHPHIPRNVNDRVREQRVDGTRLQQVNVWLAIHSTRILGSMWCFYAFLLLAFSGFPGIPWLMCTPQVFISWLSSQTIQLIALPLLGAGSVVLSRHAELQADEQFHATQRTLHESQQTVRHLDAQDAELLRQTAMLARLVAHLVPAEPSEVIPAASAPASKPRRASRSRVTAPVE